jgi:hypothetical protein
MRSMRTRQASVPQLSANMERSSLLVNHLRADQQLSTCWLPLQPMQCEQLQAHGEAVQPEARPRNHAIFLERIVVHDLEPGKKMHSSAEPCRISLGFRGASINKTVFLHIACSFPMVNPPGNNGRAWCHVSKLVVGTGVAYAHYPPGIALC